MDSGLSFDVSLEMRQGGGGGLSLVAGGGKLLARRTWTQHLLRACMFVVDVVGYNVLRFYCYLGCVTLVVVVATDC